MKISNIIKFKGNISLEEVEESKFKGNVLILMYLPIIFNERTIFAPCLYTDGSYRMVPLILGNTGSVVLKLVKSNDAARPKVIYLDQIDIIKN